MKGHVLGESEIVGLYKRCELRRFIALLPNHAEAKECKEMREKSAGRLRRRTGDFFKTRGRGGKED